MQVNDDKPIEVLTDDVREAIMKNVRRRMTPQPVKIRADVELTCFAYDGVLALQACGNQLLGCWALERVQVATASNTPTRCTEY